MLCPSCGVRNPPDSRFCMSCGRRLEDEVIAGPQPLPPRAPSASDGRGFGAVQRDGDAAPAERPGPVVANNSVGATPPAAFAAPSPPQERSSTLDSEADATRAVTEAPQPPARPVPAANPVQSLLEADPHGLAGAASRLAPRARDAARTSLIVCAAVLLEDEQVAAVAQGTIDGIPAVVALTDRRLVAVNQRDWSPTVTSFALDGADGVTAWEDERASTVTFEAGGQRVLLAAILDKAPARDLIARIRASAGA